MISTDRSTIGRSVAALNARRPKLTPIRELERYMRRKGSSRIRDYLSLRTSVGFGLRYPGYFRTRHIGPSLTPQRV
jgi:hypothetical protein